jgi:hypothetical protein
MHNPLGRELIEGETQRCIDTVVIKLAIRIVVSSLVFSSSSVIWLGFSAAVAVLALAVTQGKE